MFELKGKYEHVFLSILNKYILQPNILNQMIYTRAGNLQVSTDYESTNQREINLNRKVHINLNNTAPSVGTIAG